VDTSTKATEPIIETQTCQAEAGSSASAENDGACSAVDTPDEKKASVGANKKHPECGLYIAESTISNAGVGKFTARTKKPMDPVGSGDVSMFDLFNAYYWSAFSMGMTRESHDNDIDAYCPGLDSTANSNLTLSNTQKKAPRYDNAGLHRFQDPSMGAFTCTS
jgi:hypothetical protein